MSGMGKIYTAILNRDGLNSAVDVTVTRDREEARREVEQKYPGYELVALVPGKHADWTEVYQPDIAARARRDLKCIGSGIKNVDVWSVPDILPTG